MMIGKMMTSRPQVPVDPGSLAPGRSGEGPTRPMETPRVVNPEVNVLGTQKANSNSTANSVHGAEGWPRYPNGGEDLGGSPETAHNLIPRGEHRTTGEGVGDGATAPVPPWTGENPHPAARGR
jgi:hypothetical protein